VAAYAERLGLSDHPAVRARRQEVRRMAEIRPHLLPAPPPGEIRPVPLEDGGLAFIEQRSVVVATAEEIEAILGTSPETRVASLIALSRFRTTVRTKSLLLKLTLDLDASVRHRALAALAPTLPPEEKRKIVLRAIADEEDSVRLAAMQHLAALTSEDLEGPLIEAIRKDKGNLAYFAMKSVVERGDDEVSRRVFRRIVAELTGAGDNRISSIYGVASRVLTDEMVIEALSHPHLQVRQQAARMAGGRHLLDAWPILLRAQRNDPRDPFRQALEQIRAYHIGMKEYLDLKDAGGLDLFMKAEELARSENVEHRIAACYAFAALKGPRALSRLLDLVRDEQVDVRSAALQALKKMGEGGEGAK
jgi:HEAT repeat protein